ncbi:MAG: hypothetical protein COA79_10745 [Planctomycetota bacterium]|nr:MAG: hypothetical protein COA79_10745 [Planctomycetota bacterium]
MSESKKQKIITKLNNFDNTQAGNINSVNYRGYLPHFEICSHYQMITYRLNDSLPAKTLEKLNDAKNNDSEYRKAIETQMDAGHGSSILKEPAIANMIINNWKYFHIKRYELIAYVVMPNHVHVLIKLNDNEKLSKIVHSWKSFTSKHFSSILKNLNLSSRDAEGNPIKWQRDYWDRYIRNVDHYLRSIDYIHNNPRHAGICSSPDQWPFSSFSSFKSKPGSAGSLPA